ncbi:hypothetical protein AUCHE_08_01140 [Austwickia chelonae NBRC 105200]|uniref:Uncharacterized protein n=1 Tax=Austwickia chelonae NBRC 105200 TaxID=1184607 RepID=K6UM76_9MICO|nr:hypothetical protein AUCHE_08_01140 [Austwickia chelonae NBRC 105200]
MVRFPGAMPGAAMPWLRVPVLSGASSPASSVTVDMVMVALTGVRDRLKLHPVTSTMLADPIQMTANVFPVLTPPYVTPDGRRGGAAPSTSFRLRCSVIVRLRFRAPAACIRLG